MKVAMYYSQRDICIENMKTPEIGEDEVLVQMKACGICGSDLMSWYLKSRAPLVLGHEPAGIIKKKGDKVKGFNVGDRVFVHHHVACLQCYYCLHEEYTLCNLFSKTNINPGGLAEYFKVPAPNLKIDTLKISETLSFDEATLIEPVGCCLKALKKCNIQKGDFVAVIGAGTTGIIHTALSRTFHAKKIIVSDLVDYRLNIAKKFGADIIVNPRKEDLAEVVMAETNGRGVDIVVITAPNLEAYKVGLSICRKGGKLSFFAPLRPTEYLKISPKNLFFSEIQIIPSYSTSHLEIKTALQLIETGRLRVKELITHRFKLVDAARAFETALESKENLKVIVFN